jgi:hypothetical protein
MELEVGDRVTADPKPGDIVAAIGEAGSDAEWSLTLSDDDGYVEAYRQDDGSFRIVRHDGTTKFDGTEPVDAEALKRLLLAYLAGDKRWRKQQDWVRAPSPSKSAAATGEPPAWAIAAVVGSVVFIIVVSNLPREWLPFLDTTAGTIALFALPVVVMIGAMIANVGLKMHRAKGWLQVEGRITRSKLMVRRPSAGNDIGTAVNVPDIAYSFMAGGLSYQGRRVSLGDISGKFAEEAVRRYPVGSVVTVYYDPADPSDCVLERGLVLDAPAVIDTPPVASASNPAAPAAPTRAAPKASAAGCGIALAVLGAFGAAGWWLAHGGVQEIQTRMPRAEVPVMLCAIGFGLVLLLFFVGYRRRLMRANSWPVVPGRVTVSRIEQRGGGYEGGTHRSYEAVVEFRYRVGDLDYSSRQIALGLERSGSRTGAERIAARYPVGAAVEVHYDPANPSEAALENPTGTSWLILGAAIACFGVALYASRLFR